MGWILKWILVSHTHTHIHFVDRYIFLLFLFFLLLLLPSSLRGAVKMTAFHHLLFELLRWELPGWFIIHTVAAEKEVRVSPCWDMNVCQADAMCSFCVKLSRKLQMCLRVRICFVLHCRMSLSWTTSLSWMLHNYSSCTCTVYGEILILKCMLRVLPSCIISEMH